MTVLEHQIQIEAPMAAVWDVLAELTAVRDYNPAVARVEYLSAQRSGIGAGRRCELKPSGWVVERVVGWEPPRVLAIEVVESTWPIAHMGWRTALSQSGRGTMVSQRLEYRPKFGVLGVLLDRIKMRGAIDETVAGTFRELKRLVEARARPAPPV